MAKNTNMIYKKIKIVRVIWSSLVLLIFLSFFLFTENVFAVAADAQFIPSGIKFITFFSITVFAFFMLLTIFFGRVYCSFICPLGVMQDIAIRIGKVFKLSRQKKQFSRNRRTLRYSVLAIILGALSLGVAIPLGMFGPFAVFGRFTAAIIKPSFVRLNNLLLDNAFFESLNPLHNSPFSLPLLVIASAVFIAIMITASFRGRLFCNTICPAGAILGLLSKISWLKIVFNHQACIKCGKCAKVCKANCIDIKHGIVDNERCVSCFNCSAACEYDAINYVHSKETKNPKPDLSKRDFLIIGSSAVLGAAVVPKLLKGIPSPKAVMPPGALNFDSFTSKCTACQLCVSNCPGNVLKPAALQYGLSGFLQPRLDFNSGMCEFECTTCSNICPNGALTPLSVERKKRLQIGLAKYFRKRCVVVTDRTHCGACAEHCPTGAVHMVDWQDGLTIPRVKPELCIGCGACEFICPVKPEKAIIVSGSSKQVRAKVASIKQAVDHLKGQDFPF